jgi:hypothetical protein
MALVVEPPRTAMRTGWRVSCARSRRRRLLRFIRSSSSDSLSRFTVDAKKSGFSAAMVLSV